MHHVDVIIVGGGPSGAACGALLAREGLRVLLCEKAKFPRDKICGECVNPRCWDYFEILGIAHELRSVNLHTIDSFRVTSAHGASLAGNIPAGGGRPFFSIARSQLDTLLLANAQASGATVLESTAVETLEWKNRWEVRAASGLTFTASFLVGADGRNSLVARKVSGLPPTRVRQKHRTSSHGNRVGVQWHAASQPRIGSAIEMFLFESGYSGVVNIDAHRANVALVTRPEIAQLAQKDFPSFLARTLFGNPAARKQLEFLTPLDEIHAAFPITPTLKRTTHPYAFLVGDARQTVEPFTGEGILFALQDAFITARMILAQYHKNHFPRLPSYNRWLANRFFSPTLRRPRLANTLLALGTRFPRASAPVVKSLFSFVL